MAKATLKSRVSGFLKGAQTNGNSGLVLVLDAIDHWREHNDPVHFLRLVNSAAASDARQFRMIGAAIVTGANAKMTGAADGAQLQFDASAIAKFRELAAQGASFRSYGKSKSDGGRRDAVPYSEKLAAAAAAAYKQNATLDQFLAEAKLAYQNAVAKANA